MRVSGEEECAFHQYGEPDLVAGAGLHAVHVTAVVVRCQRVHGLDLGRHTHRPHERLVGDQALLVESHPTFLEGQEQPLFLQCFLQGRIEPRRRQTAEVGDGAGHGMVACRLDLVNLDDQRVARLGALHHDRAGLRVQERGGAYISELLDLGGHLVLERIEGVDADRLPWLHLRNRRVKRRVGVAIGPAVLTNLANSGSHGVSSFGVTRAPARRRML